MCHLTALPVQVAELLQEARCDDVAVLDVRPRECSFTDFFVLATGRSHQHIFTAAHAVKYAVRLVLQQARLVGFSVLRTRRMPCMHWTSYLLVRALCSTGFVLVCPCFIRLKAWRA